jgi:hypothetical protein
METKTTGNFELINQYAERTAKLDEVLNNLTREFCAEKCLSGPIGCCQGQCYQSFEVPKEMLQLQEQQAIENGWKPHNEPVCKYHSETGCSLTTLKSPLCIGYICRHLAVNLGKQFKGKESFFNFWKSMESMAANSFNEGTILNLEKAIDSGRKLVEMKGINSK